jgi:hypothetical protein
VDCVRQRLCIAFHSRSRLWFHFNSHHHIIEGEETHRGRGLPRPSNRGCDTCFLHASRATQNWNVRIPVQVGRVPSPTCQLLRRLSYVLYKKNMVICLRARSHQPPPSITYYSISLFEEAPRRLSFSCMDRHRETPRTSRRGSAVKTGTPFIERHNTIPFTRNTVGESHLQYKYLLFPSIEIDRALSIQKERALTN